jgi:hypothetical protein
MTLTQEQKDHITKLAQSGAELGEVNDFVGASLYSAAWDYLGEIGVEWDGEGRLIAPGTAASRSTRIAPLQNVAPVSVAKEEWWQGIGIYSDYKFSNFGRVSRMTGRRGAGADQPIRVQPSAKPIKDRNGKIVRVGWVMMANLTLPNGKQVKRNIARILADAMKGMEVRTVAPWFAGAE